MAALTRYLQAPAHRALGDLFSTATAAALAYDFEMTDIVLGRSEPVITGGAVRAQCASLARSHMPGALTALLR